MKNYDDIDKQHEHQANNSDDAIKPESSGKPNYYDLDALTEEAEPLKISTNGKGKRKGMTLGEIGELSKKKPGELSSEQRAELTAFTKKASEVIDPHLDGIRDAVANMNKKGILDAQAAIKDIRIPNLGLIGPHNFPTTLDPFDNMPMPTIIPSPTSAEQRKQTALLSQLLVAIEGQNMERDKDQHLATQPRYDSKKRLLIFANTVIEIPEESDQEQVCKSLFRSGKPVKKPVSVGEILDKIGVPIDRIKGNKKVHSAKQALNDRVEKATQIKDLFVIDNKKIWFNQKFL